MEGLTETEEREKNQLTLSIPANDLKDWRTRRLVNLQTNKRLIRMAQRDAFIFLPSARMMTPPFPRPTWKHASWKIWETA